MEQLSLSLFDLPSPYAHVWEGLAAQQRAVVLEILARMIVQSVQAHAHAQEAAMSEGTKLQPTHLQRTAIVYVRQSSAAQVENNRESTQRQYALVERAAALGWQRDQISVIDDDLGMSGATSAQRSGFARLTTEVALEHVGIVLGLEVSRLARNNADWYRLLDLCGMTDTLIGDGDGIYHPALFNDRLVLGLKGTMSEAELHVLRARLEGGIRNKAARGELRRGLPVGFVWGEEDGEVLLQSRCVGHRRDPHRLRALRRAGLGTPSVAVVSLRRSVLPVANQRRERDPLGRTHLHHDPPGAAQTRCMLAPTSTARPAWSATSTPQGGISKRLRQLPRAQWSVLIREHHEGYIDWATYEANQSRMGSNIRPRPHQAGGAVREGAALLQGIAVCGRCGRRLHTHYAGRTRRSGLPLPGQDPGGGTRPTTA